MATTLSQLAPAFAGLFIGYLLHRRGVFTTTDGEFLFRLGFYTCTPALAFSSLASVSITAQLLLFALMAPIVAGLAFGVGQFVSTRLRLTGTTKPTFVLACMIINSAFVLIFAQALYGAAGVARVTAFSATNFCITFGWAYALAASSNPDHEGSRFPIRKILLSPPLYGAVVGIAVNLANIEVPSTVMHVVDTFGDATVFTLSIATGVLFAPARTDFLLIAKVIAVRTVCGLAVGIGLLGLATCSVHFRGIANLSEMDKALVLMLSVTPVAFNCVTFASMEKLDADFAAGALSVSLVLGLVLITAIAAFYV